MQKRKKKSAKGFARIPVGKRMRGVGSVFVPHYECASCGRRLPPGGFIAVVGKVPPDCLSLPYGRADALLNKIGKTYCEECYNKI